MWHVPLVEGGFGNPTSGRFREDLEDDYRGFSQRVKLRRACQTGKPFTGLLILGKAWYPGGGVFCGFDGSIFWPEIHHEFHRISPCSLSESSGIFSLLC